MDGPLGFMILLTIKMSFNTWREISNAHSFAILGSLLQTSLSLRHHACPYFVRTVILEFEMDELSYPT